MDRKPAYEFTPDMPTQIQLSFDQPKTGEGQYGAWYLYGAIINGQQENFFASPTLHQKMQFVGMRKGSVAVITVRAKINANTNKPYKDYELNFNGTLVTLPANSPAPNQTVRANVQQRDREQYVKDEETKWKEIGWGKCKTLFLVELMKMGKDVINAEPEAERWADASMRPKSVTPTPHIPTYTASVDEQQYEAEPQEEINISSIPF